MQICLTSLFCPSCPGTRLHRDHHLELMSSSRAIRHDGGPATPPFFIRCIKRGGQLWHLFDPRDIGSFVSRDKYTWFTWSWSKTPSLELCDLPLASLAQALLGQGFVRTHRSALVNLRFIQRAHLTANRGGTLDLWDGQSVQVSRRAVPALRLKLSTSTTPPPHPRTPQAQARDSRGLAATAHHSP